MMIIARAPLRVSLAGGGTDLPSYSDRFGGLVLSTAIDRYVYVILSKADSDTLRVTAADANSVLSRREHLFDSALFWGADYRLPLEVLDYFGVQGGCRILIAPEVPPGTGLGSSSATAVALITALAAYQRRPMSKRELADTACHVEIDRMHMPIGRQDQFAAAYGGLNVLTFGPERTEVHPCAVSAQTCRDLQDRILLFFTGLRRRSTDILTAQRAAIEQDAASALAALHDIKAIAREMVGAIEAGELDAVGELLDLSWERKRRLAAGISTPEIDGWYRAAKEAGASGGKITGAGGGGFLMLFVAPERRQHVIQRMTELGLVWVDTGFDYDGASATDLPVPQPVPAD